MNNLKKIIKENIEKLNKLDTMFHNFFIKHVDSENKEENDPIYRDYDMLMDKLRKIDGFLSELKNKIYVNENVIKKLSNNPEISKKYVEGLEATLNDIKDILNKHNI